MNQAWIKNGRVIEIIDAQPGLPPVEERYHPDVLAQCVPAQPGVAEGWLWDGQAFSSPGPAAPPAPVVPDVIALWQFRRELRARGWWAPVQAAIAAMPADARDDVTEWLEYGAEAHRQSPLLVQVASALGFDADLDDAFIAAAARAL